jgi:chromosomal replication initiator protein
MEAEWLEALPRLRQRMGERNFATWIEPVQCARDADGWRLEVPSRFFQEWLSRHFLSAIRETLGAGAAAPPSVRVVVSTPGTAPAPVPQAPVFVAAPTPAGLTPAAPGHRGAALRVPKFGHLVAEYTFETFVVGEANAVAWHAVHAVAESPGRRFNPVFLWGGVGLGKTHLINALAHELLGRLPRRRVAALAAETFMNTLIAALRQDKMGAFRDRFRDLDVLILDDVQFLAGKERTQEEFFHTFNALHMAGRQVVLTSDKPPHAIDELEHRLKSRFEGGLIADIHPPTAEMRVAIVLKKAAHHGVDLAADVARVVAERSGPTVRELEGALTRLVATTSLRGIPLDLHAAEQVLPPVASPPPITVEAIQQVVSQRFHVSVEALTSHHRERTVAFARQVAMYFSRTLAESPFASIAEKFGGRDHSTVMYAVRTVEAKGAQDPATAHLLRTLEAEIRSQAGKCPSARPTPLTAR